MFTAIILIGPPGSGKSVCGQAIARRLGWTFIDTDLEIVQATGQTIPQLFQTAGEAHFRKLESAIIDRLSGDQWRLTGAEPGRVIATGGGMPVVPGNWERLAGIGPIICLTALPQILLERLQTDGGRPLLAAAKPDSELTPASRERVNQRLLQLLQERAHIYARAHYKIETSHLSPDQVADQALKLLGIST